MVIDKRLKGVFYASLASATYGLNPLFAIPLYRRGMNAESVLTYRYMVGAILLALIMLWRKDSFRLEKRQILPQIFCGIMMSLSSLALFVSYNHMDVGIASTLLFVYPVMVAAIMTAFFKEKMSWVTTVCLSMAVIGVVMLNWNGEGHISIKGLCLALLSALTWALYLVAVKKTALQRLGARCLTFYSLVIGLPLFLSRLGWGRDIRLPNSAFSWTMVLLIAALPTIVSMVSAALAVQCVGPTVTSIFGALEPLTAVIIGVCVFGEPLTLSLLFGFLVITAAVTIIALKK